MTQAFDELFAPKAMSLDELFAAIRPPPLLPVSYPPSDNSDFMSSRSVAGVNAPQSIPLDRLWGGVPPAPLKPLNYRDPSNYEAMPAGTPPSLAAYTRLPAGSAAPSDSNPFEINSSPLVNSMFSGASNIPRLQNIAAQRQMPSTLQPRIYGSELDANSRARPLPD